MQLKKKPIYTYRSVRWESHQTPVPITRQLGKQKNAYSSAFPVRRLWPHPPNIPWVSAIVVCFFIFYIYIYIYILFIMNVYGAVASCCWAAEAEWAQLRLQRKGRCCGSVSLFLCGAVPLNRYLRSHAGALRPFSPPTGGRFSITDEGGMSMRAWRRQ